MENIDFVLWVCLFPTMVSVCRYLDAKRKGTTDKETFDYSVIYIGIALILAFN